MSRKLVGGYEVIRRLGAGGMGEVLLARDPKLERLVAIKVLRSDFAVDPLARKRFHREARALASLRHPGVVTIYEIGEDDGLDFIVMEYLHGGNLRAHMIRQPLDHDGIVDLARQIADAIAGAHGAGVLHRDIKPENIMVLDDGSIRVVDFGLARSFDEVEGAPPASPDAVMDLMGDTVEAGEMPTLSRAATEPGDSAEVERAPRRPLTAATETILGTPAYMAPELFLGEKPSAASDVYSLGVLIYEMCSGHLPFAAESLQGLLKELIYEYAPAPRLDEKHFATAEIASLVETLLDPEHSNRPSIADVVESLEAMAGPTTERVEPLAPQLRSSQVALSQEIEVAPARRQRQRQRVLGVLGLATILAGGLYYVRSGVSSRAPGETARIEPRSSLAENSIRIAIKPFESNLRSYAHANGPVATSSAAIMASLLNRTGPILAIPPSQLLGHIGDGEHEASEWMRAGHEVGAMYLADATLANRDGKVFAHVTLTNLLDRSVQHLEPIEGPEDRLDTLLFTLASQVAAVAAPGTKLVAAKDDTRRSVDSLALYEKALENLYDNKWVAACVQLEQIVSEQPAFFEAWYHLAIASAWAAQPREKSLAAAETARELASTERDRSLMNAIIAYIERDFLTADPMAEALAKTFPRDPEIAYLHAETTYHNGHYERGLELFDKAIRLAPRSNLASTHPIQHAEVNGNLERWEHYHALRATRTPDDVAKTVRDDRLRFALGEYEALVAERPNLNGWRIAALSTLQRDAELDKEIANVETLGGGVLEHAMARAMEIGDRERANALFRQGYATIAANASTAGNRFRILTFPEVLIVGGMKEELREFLSYWALDGPEKGGAQEAEFRAFAAPILEDASLVRRDGYGSWREQERAKAILAELEGRRDEAVAIWQALLEDPSQWGDLLDRVALARNLHALGRKKELEQTCLQLLRPKFWRSAYSVARMKCREWKALPKKRDPSGAFTIKT